MLKEPLSQNQIAVAVQIRRQLPMWAAAEHALLMLGRKIPGSSLPETMLKVAAVNQLYGTNLYAVTRMAKHITSTISKNAAAGPTLVERIACIPGQGGQRTWRHFSFASKFCHFFVNRDACPIFDTYAEDTLRLHLGRNRVRDEEHPYVAFVANARKVASLAGVSASAVDFDSYLWLRGAFEKWSANPSRKMNSELKEFFSNKANRHQLAALVDSTMQGAKPGQSSAKKSESTRFSS